MKCFEKPCAVSNNGKVEFVLYDGTKTKSVFAFLEFDNCLGMFGILNEKYEVVEYMDILGNFSKKPTMFAKRFNEYINSSKYGIGYGCPQFMFFTSLIDFPSKYLSSKKVRQIVKQEEEFKYKKACIFGEFSSLLEKLKYRLYYKKIYKQKIDKMKSDLKCKTENFDQQNYFEL